MLKVAEPPAEPPAEPHFSISHMAAPSRSDPPKTRTSTTSDRRGPGSVPATPHRCILNMKAVLLMVLEEMHNILDDPKRHQLTPRSPRS